MTERNWTQLDPDTWAFTFSGYQFAAASPGRNPPQVRCISCGKILRHDNETLYKHVGVHPRHEDDDAT